LYYIRPCRHIVWIDVVDTTVGGFNVSKLQLANTMKLVSVEWWFGDFLHNFPIIVAPNENIT
jgi:hypothetical protein